MTHVATAPHECEGNLIFCERGLSPYWILGKVLTRGYDGHGEIEVEIDGEPWTVSLTYQKGGVAPRLQDDIGGDRLYEYRIGANGRGERKANFLIQPRFADMRHHETDEPISTPFDHIAAEEGVNVRFSGSNLEPGTFRNLLPRFVQALGQESGYPINTEYFGGQVHEMSNITTYERYVRVRRGLSSKLVGQTGIFHRLFQLYADQQGSQYEYSADNEEIVGKNHQFRISKRDARELVSGHRLGKQIKHYHPKHVRSNDEGDPLYHPKVGVLLKKSLNGHAFSWDKRRELRQEIDETLINLLYWADVPTQADQTTYVPDKHFEARPAERTVSFEDDPTPEMEAKQEALLGTTLREMTESDVEILESLVTDGCGQHPEELAVNTDRSISTIYRSLERLQELVSNENASVSFTSRKIEQEIAGVVEQTEHQINNAADRVSSLLGMETRAAASSAWQKWCNKYAAKVVQMTEDQGNDVVVRIDTVLSELKSTPQPQIQSVLKEAIESWHAVDRDVLELRNARVKWRDPTGSWREGKVSANLR